LCGLVDPVLGLDATYVAGQPLGLAVRPPEPHWSALGWTATVSAVSHRCVRPVHAQKTGQPPPIPAEAALTNSALLGPFGQVDQSGGGAEILVPPQVTDGPDVERLLQARGVACADAGERVNRGVDELVERLLLVRLVEDLVEIGGYGHDSSCLGALPGRHPSDLTTLALITPAGSPHRFTAPSLV